MIRKLVNLLFKLQQILVVQVSLQGILEILQFGALRRLVDRVCDVSGPLDKFHYLQEISLLAAAGGHGRTANSDSRRNEGALIAGNCVFVDSNRDFIHDCFNSATVDTLAAHVSHKKMVISAS